MADQAGVGDRIAEAHKRLLADRTLQFDFSPPPHVDPPPAWLRALGEFLHGIAPAMKYVFWGGVAIGLLLLAWFVARELIHRRWPSRERPMSLQTGMAPWQPTTEAAKALLADADRLAAEGRFVDAAHLLLLRSIDDLRGRRPGLVRPALTSRDIAALEALPASAQPAFGLIAEVVEKSWFGGRPVDADAWRLCRNAYEEFALPKAWAA